MNQPSIFYEKIAGGVSTAFMITGIVLCSIGLMIAGVPLLIAGCVIGGIAYIEISCKRR